MIRSFSHEDFPLELLLERKQQTVSVVLPAREVADTVGLIVERIRALGELVDQILVVDADSEDGSADVARAAGAEVRSQRGLRPELGEVLGKGDAMWRALAATSGDIVAYVDSDTRDFTPDFITGMLGPLICEPEIQFVKGTYRRPFTSGDEVVPDGGGRVSQLTARPLLAAFYPDIAELSQPLAGEVAAPRKVFEQLPFATGYAVETAMLLDVREAVGADAIAECHLGERRNHHQPLHALRPMAEEVLAVVCERLRREGRLRDGGLEHSIVHRPPYAEAAAA
ncbi:MAG: glucosyl-3-phosphoglycerate synthase [Thermoleophilaceae bacterium]